jgi:hypothetical protein
MYIDIKFQQVNFYILYEDERIKRRQLETTYHKLSYESIGYEESNQSDS